jgi:murein DD-endopeptidase MepM/ murein hydrolase activator NlpD
MRVARVLKMSISVVAVAACVILALWLWYGPQSPVGRCSRYPWPDDPFLYGLLLNDHVHKNGTRRLYLALWDSAKFPQPALILKLPVPFKGLSEGMVVPLTNAPKVFVSEPIPRDLVIDTHAQVKMQPLPGWIPDRAKLPTFIEGEFPVTGRSWISQTVARNPKTSTHWPHRGMEHAIDIAAPIGTPVLAMRPGKVVRLRDGWPDFPCGTDRSLRNSVDNTIYVEDETGVTIVYAHLQLGSLKVKEGDRVVAGQQIAAVGRSGTGMEASHLHIEAGGGIVDPKTNHWVTVPLRFKVCGEQGPARALVYEEKISCPVP